MSKGKGSSTEEPETLYIGEEDVFEINRTHIIVVVVQENYFELEEGSVYKIFLNYRTGRRSVYKYTSPCPGQNAPVFIAHYPLEKYRRIHGTTIMCTDEFQELYKKYRENPDIFQEVIYGRMNLTPYLSDSSDDDK